MNVVEALHLPGLEDGLNRVEKALAGATAAEDPFLSEVAGHLVAAGGKRLRPALVVSVAHACAAAGGTPGPNGTGGISEDVIQGGVAVELVHLGSLYHDDVMDGAEYRRGVDSVNARWGNLVAILAGDFLLARASEIAASLGTEVAALLARTIGQLCEGEVTQLRYAFNPDRPEDSYLASISGKTASLMATAARIGGLTCRAPRPWVDALTAYGHCIGMTFQIWDDVRDVVSSEQELGKPAGHDMVEGTYTLPVLRALSVAGVGDDLRALLGAPLDGPAREKATNLVLSTDAVRSSLGVARRWAERANSALEPIRTGAGSEARESLEVLGGVGFRLLDELEAA
ncbi:MAG TPA: polyprenyl synthetase family protein [Acidimicrobiales bacterium]|nr:polyprenyl synthetase family protein [Acidimicrobiales bacterium]